MIDADTFAYALYQHTVHKANGLLLYSSVDKFIDHKNEKRKEQRLYMVLFSRGKVLKRMVT